MKVLVCGARDWSNDKTIETEFKKLPPGTVIIHGASKIGFDALVDKIAMKYGFPIRRYPCEEDENGGSVSKRNSKMVRQEHVSGDPIHMGLAFTNDLSRSRDVKDLVERARKAGVKVNILIDPKSVKE